MKVSEFSERRREHTKSYLSHGDSGRYRYYSDTMDLVLDAVESLLRRDETRNPP